MSGGTARRRRMRVGAHTHSVLTAGSGDPVLLLHGWPQTSHAWHKVVPLLSRTHSVIVPDLPGCGDSSKPGIAYDKKTVAALLRGLVEALGHRRISIVGHDVGGQVAWAYAAQWPAEVSRLVIMESALPGITSDDVANPLIGGSWHYGFNMLRDLPEALVSGRERTFVQFVMFRDTVGVFESDAVDEDDVDRYAAALAQPGALRGSFGYYRSLGQDAIDNRELVRDPFTVPTLAVAAEHSYGDEWLQSVAGLSRHHRQLLLRDSGHYMPEEQPAALTDALVEFFATGC